MLSEHLCCMNTFLVDVTSKVIKGSDIHTKFHNSLIYILEKLFNKIKSHQLASPLKDYDY